VWPETARISGLSAFTLVSVDDMSFRSGGSLSSITTCMPHLFAASTTPLRTSWEKSSFSIAIATLSDFGSLPCFRDSSATTSIAGLK
jgi:hypothetical protein